MAWFLCWESTTRLLATLIKVVVNARVLSLFISSHGTAMLWISYNLRKITARRKTALEIFFTHSGFLICLWNVCKRMVTGLFSAQTERLVSMNAMVLRLKNFTLNMKQKVGAIRPWKLKNCGRKLLKVRLKLVRLTCSTRITLTENPINKIWAPSKARIFVVKLWNTLQRMKLPSATLLPFVFLGLFYLMVHTTLLSFTVSLAKLLET